MEINLEKEREKEGIEKLREILAEISDNLEKEGVPVDVDCRIDMPAFNDIYGKEVERDLGREEEKIMEEEEKTTIGEAMDERVKRDGEKLEMLKTVIFNKFLGRDFIVVRSSLYDDRRNGIDNIILEKETGNLVCAFDEVAAIKTQKLDEKIRQTREKNREGGGVLKYGISLEKGKIIKKALGELPVFYLTLSRERIEEGIKRLSIFSESPSLEEKLIFRFFIESLSSQIPYLNLESDLSANLRKRLTRFEAVLQRLKTKE